MFYGNAKIYLPRGYYFSFANSPYYAHQYLKAIDIYPIPEETLVVSPFNGKLVYYKVIHNEHVSGYKVGDYYVRLLHLKPFLQVGEEVEVGDVLGELVESPYFYPWTDPHIHLEIRSKPEFIRASGGLRLRITKSFLKDVRETLLKSSILVESKIKGEIALVEPNRYMLMKTGSTVNGLTTPLIVSINGVLGFIDGGIPHYRHGLLITPYMKIVDETVRLSNIIIGVVDEYYNEGFNHFQVDRRKVKVFVDDTRIRGLGLYIGCPLIKIIPLNWTGIDYRVGDVVEVFFKNTTV